MLLLSGAVENDPGLSLEERQAEMQKYLHWLQELRAKGIVRSGQPLGNEGRVIRKADGLITDGPFTETKEAIGGYFIIRAEDMDAAVEIAKTCPHVLMGGTIEVRPLNEI